ncbi:MAG: STAS domain-containing protein [Phycisphaerales bacterium]|nr:STAS domain-containing protein [Phycisphaerales bacterium]
MQRSTPLASPPPESIAPTDQAVVLLEPRPQGLIIRPVGPHLAEREAGRVRDVVLPAIEAFEGRLRAVVIDLSDIQWMTSVGLGVCVDIRNAAKGRRAKCYTIGLNDELDRLFRMVKVHRVFRTLQTNEQVDRLLAA